MRVTLIHNTGAGDGDGHDARALQALIRDAGHEVQYQSLGDDTWSAVLDSPADVVAVAGGDGTVGRVAKKMIGRRTPLAPLPLGTANNISKTLGLTELTLEEIVRGWSHARRVTFDAGVARGPWGARYFVEGVGVGLFARTISAADESKTLAALTDRKARIAYALEMLRERLARASPHALKLTIDGNDASGEYVLFEAMNMEFVGPNLYLAPDIQPADGLLDLVLVSVDERDKLRKTLAQWSDGERAHPDLPRQRARVIELEWDGSAVHFDDEAWPPEGAEPAALTHITISVERDALLFLAPARE